MTDLESRIAAALEAARADHVPRCAFCRATADLEPWREEDYPPGFACVDEDACHTRFQTICAADDA